MSTNGFPETRPRWRRHATSRQPAIAGTAATLVAAILCAGTGYRYTSDLGALAPEPSPETAAATPAELRAQERRLTRTLRDFTPRGAYVVVDRVHNRLTLREGTRTVLESVCSVGSGMVLEADGRRWVFDTPRGTFRATSKLEWPLWRKPDWAFFEEGKLPPRDESERFESGSLGEYGIAFGDGYLIHGTLYERLLGRPVSHGCIRLGKEDLRRVYRAVHVGTPIYIY